MIKVASGVICLKYKVNGITLDYEDAICENSADINKPDFAFIDDIYIPKFFLKEYKITKNIDATVKALNGAKGWQVFSIELTKDFQ